MPDLLDEFIREKEKGNYPDVSFFWRKTSWFNRKALFTVAEMTEDVLEEINRYTPWATLAYSANLYLLDKSIIENINKDISIMDQIEENEDYEFYITSASDDYGLLIYVPSGDYSGIIAQIKEVIEPDNLEIEIIEE